MYSVHIGADRVFASSLDYAEHDAVPDVAEVDNCSTRHKSW